MSEVSNTKEREDTACIEITCSVKGYQECIFTVDVGEEFFIFKKIGSKGRAFKVTNTRGQLGHLNSHRNCLLFVFFCSNIDILAV